MLAPLSITEKATDTISSSAYTQTIKQEKAENLWLSEKNSIKKDLFLLAEQLSCYKGIDFLETRNQEEFVWVIKQILEIYACRWWNSKNLWKNWGARADVRRFQKEILKMANPDGYRWPLTTQAFLQDAWYQSIEETNESDNAIEWKQEERIEQSKDNDLMQDSTETKTTNNQPWTTSNVEAEEEINELNLLPHKQVIEKMKWHLIDSLSHLEIAQEKKEEVASLLIAIYEGEIEEAWTNVEWTQKSILLKKKNGSVVRANISLDTINYMWKKVNPDEEFDTLYDTIQNNQSNDAKKLYKIPRVAVHEKELVSKNGIYIGKKYKEWKQYIIRPDTLASQLIPNQQTEQAETEQEIKEKKDGMVAPPLGIKNKRANDAYKKFIDWKLPETSPFNFVVQNWKAYRAYTRPTNSQKDSVSLAYKESLWLLIYKDEWWQKHVKDRDKMIAVNQLSHKGNKVSSKFLFYRKSEKKMKREAFDQ